MSKMQRAGALEMEESSVEEGVGAILDHAVAVSASDVFFGANEDHVAVSFRRLGMIQPLATLPLDLGRRYLAYIKTAAGMDIAERRRPLDGRWIHALRDGRTVDLRINTIPTMHGEDFAIHILERDSQLRSIDRLGMSNHEINHLITMLNSPSGLILVTGPTGSGKTTTLYGCLSYLNDGRRKIHAIEDPIEYAIPGIRQSQVNPKIDLGFPELLRAIVRQSPDVIMIGEVRDEITAETAVRAANSGHLVFATLHAPVAAAAIQSMRSLGVRSHFLSTCLLGVIAQRLIRTLCPKCRTSFDIGHAPHTFDEVRQWLGPEEGKLLHAPRGCEACEMSGYDARTGVFEIMVISQQIRQLIADGRATREIRLRAIEEGMQEFRHAAMLKVARGLTSTEEVFRTIPPEYLLLED
jgi:type II secretory ATPase GspE/PulE/Tfp pilus assembly ATPase PilB-like protein